MPCGVKRSVHVSHCYFWFFFNRDLTEEPKQKNLKSAWINAKQKPMQGPMSKLDEIAGTNHIFKSLNNYYLKMSKFSIFNALYYTNFHKSYYYSLCFIMNVTLHFQYNFNFFSPDFTLNKYSNFSLVQFLM